MKTQIVVYLKLADLAITQHECDPILRANLVKLFLEFAKESSIDDIGEFDNHLSKLSSVDIDVTWMDPDCREAKNIRNQISRILDEIKSFEPLLKKIQTNTQEMMASLAPYEPIGVLINRNQNLNISKQVEKGELYIVITSEEGKYSMKKIGSILGKDARIEIGEEDTFPLGSPVYVSQR